MVELMSIKEATDNIKDGLEVMIGGFMAIGTPENLIDGIVEKGVSDLTVIANDTALPDQGIGKLIVNRQVNKVIATHIGLNPETGKQMNNGDIEVDLIPQGTLAEQIRSAGAGLGGILTPTGIGTVVEEGKEKKTINGKEYLLELPISADVALIKAWKADRKGNLVYRKSARNFNPVMATAADLVIVEVENLVETGEIDPDDVMTPAAFVDIIVEVD